MTCCLSKSFQLLGDLVVGVVGRGLDVLVARPAAAGGHHAHQQARDQHDRRSARRDSPHHRTILHRFRGSWATRSGYDLENTCRASRRYRQRGPRPEVAALSYCLSLRLGQPRRWMSVRRRRMSPSPPRTKAPPMTSGADVPPVAARLATGDGGSVEDEPSGDGVAVDLAAAEDEVVAGGPAPAVAEGGADVDDVTDDGVAGGAVDADPDVELYRWIAQGITAQILPRDHVRRPDHPAAVGAEDGEGDRAAGDLDGVDGPDVDQVTGEQGVEQARVAGDADGEDDLATDRQPGRGWRPC